MKKMYRPSRLFINSSIPSYSFIPNTLKSSPTYQSIIRSRKFTTTSSYTLSINNALPKTYNNFSVRTLPLIPSPFSSSSSNFAHYRNSTGIILALMGLLYTQDKHTSNADSNNSSSSSYPSLYSSQPSSSNLLSNSLSSLSALFSSNTTLPPAKIPHPVPQTLMNSIPSSLTNLLSTSATSVAAMTHGTLDKNNTLNTSTLTNYLSTLPKEELSLQITFGSIAGFCSGYAVKKIGRISAFIIGISFISIQLARSQGLLTNIDPKLWENTETNLIQKLDADGDGKLTFHDLQIHTNKFISILGLNIPSGTAFSSAFFLGLRWG